MLHTVELLAHANELAVHIATEFGNTTVKFLQMPVYLVEPRTYCFGESGEGFKNFIFFFFVRHDDLRVAHSEDPSRGRSATPLAFLLRD